MAQALLPLDEDVTMFGNLLNNGLQKHVPDVITSTKILSVSFVSAVCYTSLVRLVYVTGARHVTVGQGGCGLRP